MGPEETYKLMTGIVVPRPIAWVTSVSADGVTNLAPFSCFTFVSNKPPMVGINVGRKAGELKDTGRNIHAAGAYVVNIADDTMTEAVHLSAVEHPADVSEIDVLGLETVPGDHIAVPRLRDAPISLECVLHRAIAFGDTGAEFIVGEIVAFHIRDALLTGNKIDTAALRPLARLAGPTYSALGAITTMPPLHQTPKTTLTPTD
jgi:flavin reductase (DIM6/NTAB) family NADH-FMN oxidoreductase RutF